MGENQAPGISAQGSAKRSVDERMLHRRGVQAAVWGMPLVNFRLMYDEGVRLGMRDNQILYWSRLVDGQDQTLTPNPDTAYFQPFFNTADGPIVMELPAASAEGSFNGSIMNCWQAALEDVGPAGVDAGAGGKYLILPPGYTEPVPEGFIPLQSDTFQGYALLRSLIAATTDEAVAAAVEYGRQVRLYPLAAASAPPETVFVDASGIDVDATIPYNSTFFDVLDAALQPEVWLERDRLMIDPLRTIGIHRGRPFAPQDAERAILTEALEEAREWLAARYEEKFTPNAEGSRWTLPVARELIDNIETMFTTPDSYPVDARGLSYTFLYFSARHLGGGQFYQMTIHDDDGHPFRGSNDYTLTIPANAPITGFWSVTVYDRELHTLIVGAPWHSRSSLNPAVQQNPDGSTTLYFGPKAPSSGTGNWVPTEPGRDFELMARFYGPTPGLFDGSWKLSNAFAVEPGGN